MFAVVTSTWTREAQGRARPLIRNEMRSAAGRSNVRDLLRGRDVLARPTYGLLIARRPLEPAVSGRTVAGLAHVRFPEIRGRRGGSSPKGSWPSERQASTCAARWKLRDRRRTVLVHGLDQAVFDARQGRHFELRGELDRDLGSLGEIGARDERIPIRDVLEGVISSQIRELARLVVVQREADAMRH